MLSWTGLDGNLTFNQTLQYLFTADMDDIEFSWDLDKNSTTRFIVANHFCKVLEIYPSTVGYISVLLKGNDSFSVIVNDPVNNNDLLHSQMLGDKIQVGNTEVNEELTFLINLKETQDNTGGNKCFNYPYKKYQSISQCIKAKIVQKTRSAFGFTFPLYSELDQVMKPIHRLKKHEPTLRWLQSLALNIQGGKLFMPDCLHSCGFLTATSEKQQEMSSNGRWVSIYFNDVVKVQTTVVAYDVGSLLVEVGSSLGLWLGLSAVGLFDIITAFFEVLVKKIRRI